MPGEAGPEGVLHAVLRNVARRSGSSLEELHRGLEAASRALAAGEFSDAQELLLAGLRARERVVEALVLALDAVSGWEHRGILDQQGTGVVLQGFDPGLGTEVALRVQVHGIAGTAGLEELRTALVEWRGLAHPRLPRIHEVGLEGPFFYCTRDFVPGRPILASSESLDWSREYKLRLVWELADVADFLRQRGAQCEVKASRVIVDPGGEVHLVDFNLLRAALRRVGLGEPLAVREIEELLRTEDQLSEAANVRALGLLLWRLFRLDDVARGAADSTERSLASRSLPEELLEIASGAIDEDRERRLSLDSFNRRLWWFSIEEAMEASSTAFSRGDYSTGTAIRDDVGARLTPEHLERVARRITETSGGRYTDLRCIDSGGMGIIFLGQDTDLDVLRVIKVPLKKRFSKLTREEALRLAGLRHQSIVTVHELRTTDELCFFVMDYVPGCDLEKLCPPRVREEKSGPPRPFTSVEAARIVREIALAVAYLHEQEPPVIHYDIKPKNIQIADLGASAAVKAGLRRQGRPGLEPASGTSGPRLKPERWQPVLLDFGICRCLGEGPPESGSKGWVAPERFADGGSTQPGPPSDVWNLGVLLYYLLTGGRLPFSLSASDDWKSHKTKLRVPPTHSSVPRRGIPASLHRLVLRCLQPAEERPSARRLAELLDAYVTRRARRVALGVLAAGLLVLLTAGVLLALPHLRPAAFLRASPAALVLGQGDVEVTIQGGPFDGAGVEAILGARVVGLTVKSQTREALTVVVPERLIAEHRGPAGLRIRKPWALAETLKPRALYFGAPCAFLIADLALDRGSAVACGKNLLGKGKPGLVVSREVSTLHFVSVSSGRSLRVESCNRQLPGDALAISAADLTGDGLEDLVVTLRDGVYLLANPGAGGWDSALPRPLQQDVIQSALPAIVANMVGDELPDIAIAIPPEDLLRVYENRGGEFHLRSAGLTIPIEATDRLVPAGFGRECTRDLVLISSRGAQPLIVDEDRIEPRARVTIHGTTEAFAVGDFDGDGDDDVAVTFDRDEVYFFSWDAQKTESARPGEERLGGLVREPRSQRSGFPLHALGVLPASGDEPGNSFVARRDLRGRHEMWIGVFERDGKFTFRCDGFTAVRGELKQKRGGLSEPLAVEDLDGDGALDLVLPAMDRVAVLFGSPGAGFRGLLSFKAGERKANALDPHDVALSDLDADGVPDIVTVLRLSGEIAVFYGKGDTEKGLDFEPPVFLPVGEGPRYLLVRDLDGNGLDEIVTSNYDDNSVTVLWGSRERVGTKGTESTRISFGPGTGVRKLAVADFDRNGVKDIAVATQKRGPNCREGVRIVYFDSNLGFSTSLYTVREDEEEISPRWILPHDLDGDGDEDLIVTCEDSTYDPVERAEECGFDEVQCDEVHGELAVLFNDGKGGFGGRRLYPSRCCCESEPEAVAVAVVGGTPELLISSLEAVIRRPLLPGARDQVFELGPVREEIVMHHGNADPEALHPWDRDRDGELDFLFVVDEGRNMVFVYKCRERGELVQTHFLSGESPQAVDLHDAGGWRLLAIANRGSDSVDVYRIEEESGDLTFARIKSLEVQHGDRKPGPRAVVAFPWRASAGRHSSAVATVNEDLGRIDVLFELKELSAGIEGVGAWPFGIEALDLDGDLVTDLVGWSRKTSGEEASLAILRGKAEAAEPTFEMTWRQEIAPGLVEPDVTARALSAAGWGLLDLDRDGHGDLAVADREGNAVRIFFGDGKARVRQRAPWKLPERSRGPRLISALDLDGDHRPEVVTANEDSSDACVFFGGVPESLGGFPSALAHLVPGDFDGDGEPELTVVGRDGSVAVVRAPGGKPASTVLPGLRFSPSVAAVTAADMDGDGLWDLVAVDPSEDEVLLFRSVSSGFDEPVPFRRRDEPLSNRIQASRLRIGIEPEGIAVAEVVRGTEPQGGAFPDLIVADSGAGLIVVRNAGAGWEADDEGSR